MQPAINSETDDVLLARLVHGDKQAFADIYLRYHDGIYNYLLKFTKNAALTKDLLQDLFLKLWEIREKITVTTSLQAYLYRFARNKAINQLSQIALHDSIKDEIMHRMQAGMYGRNVSEEIDWKNYERLVNQAVTSLPKQRREAFELCRVQGKSYEEAAAIMNISRNTLKEHLGLAVKSIKAYLLKHGDIVILLTWELFFQ